MAKSVYIDADCKCHTKNTDGYQEIVTDVFDGKCETYIEGYRLVPSGKSWTRDDGQVFTGEMLAPWKPFDELDAAQREYERQQIVDAPADRDAALSGLSEVGVPV